MQFKLSVVKFCKVILIIVFCLLYLVFGLDGLGFVLFWLDGLDFVVFWLDGLGFVMFWLDGLGFVVFWLDGLGFVVFWLAGLNCVVFWLDGWGFAVFWLDGLGFVVLRLFHFLAYAATLSSRIGKVGASPAEGCRVDSRMRLHWFTAHEGGGATSQMYLPYLTPLSVAGCGRL